jgi:hypothetical protein
VARVDGPTFAAYVAPAVDRVFRSGMRAARERGGRDLVGAHGGSERVGWLIEFRTSLAWPGRVVSEEQFAAVTRYRDQAAARTSLQRSADLGALDLVDGGFRASEEGQAFLAALFVHQGHAVSQHWAEEMAYAHACLGPLARTLAAAALDQGPAFAAMAPPYEPADAPPGLLLLNRLGTLRYHRSDAHAAAWTAAGLTAAAIATMPPGLDRDAIEADTNRRAALPFAALDVNDQLKLLADLAALS